ncbi:MAG: serine/threonine protein kinase, partial [Leptolyngbyaceae cyanobacterium SL_7_1]|nr:serine/threonine protein kinase [Leptolyngbyaceae cyanobacterium SL_7_1]
MRRRWSQAGMLLGATLFLHGIRSFQGRVMLIGGRYETIRELGRGGVGRTYLAEDTYRRGSPKCVVKKLQLPLKVPVLLEKARTIFEEEAQVLYRLGEHEQIPRLFAHFEQHGDFYLIQELIDGHDLRQSFSLGDRWEEKAILSFLREVLEILDFVHQQSAIHQDLKPENLIRHWQDKKLAVIDFCSIKAIRNLIVNTAGEIGFSRPLGTPAYMPPEQAAGSPYCCSDLYALGMMGIQVATGYMPNQLPRNPETNNLEWHDQARISSNLATVLDTMV